MSIKLFDTASRLGVLLIAASMIGCGSPESNSTRAAGEAGGAADPPGAASQDYAARDPDEPASAAGPDGSDGPGNGAAAAAAGPPTVLFVGTSLTAGQGVPEAQSFPLVIERRIEAAGLPYRVVNAGISGETSAGALARIDWLLRRPFDAVVLETGANDMLRGVDPAATERNIQTIIDRIREVRPDVPIVLAGMLALPNLGETYGRDFESIYPRLAERNGLAFVPFLLEGVGGERELNQRDGVHPNTDGHRIVAATVWEVLEPVLAELEEAQGRSD